MGSEAGKENELPTHPVLLTDFEIGKYEVTNAQYCEFLNAKGNLESEGGTWIYLEYSKIKYKKNQYFPESGFENHPVVAVSWAGANTYSIWKGARLPTEAEWEFAAKGGNDSKGYLYSGSNQIDEVAWYEENSDKKPHPVGQKTPNELGIFDMSGNVWEWCSDWYHDEYYKSSPEKNPQGPDTDSPRVLRDGGWLFNEHHCRVTNRYSISPNARNTRIGFRLAKNL